MNWKEILYFQLSFKFSKSTRFLRNNTDMLENDLDKKLE